MVEIFTAAWAWLTVPENSGAVAAIAATLALAGAFIGWLLSKRKKQAALEIAPPPTVATITPPADQLNALMRSVVSGPPEASTDKLIELSKQLGTTESAVRGFLQLLGRKTDLPKDDIPTLLSTVAREHLTLKTRLAALQPETLQEKIEVEAIKAALDSGDNARAHTLLEQRRLQEATAIADAEHLQKETVSALSRRRRALSDTEQNLGHLALAALDAHAADNHFKAAARALPMEDIKDRADLLRTSAQALCTFGEIRGGLPVLYLAADLARQAVEASPRATHPDLWAAAKHTHGNTLAICGQAGDSALMDDALQAYRDALEERTQQRAPKEWAATQNNLGNALRILGEMTDDANHLDLAVKAYREALKESTRQRAPMDWAATQNNLGTALLTLGEMSHDTSHLDHAIQAYRDALEVYNQQSTPMDWAMTQNNLGAALQLLSEVTRESTHLDDAIRAYRDALKVYTQQHTPMDWAMTQSNLGEALVLSAELNGNTDCLSSAAKDIRSALVVFEQSGHIPNTKLARQSLARAESALARLRAPPAPPPS